MSALLHPGSIRFGTDGIRGPVGVWPMDPVGCVSLGYAMGLAYRDHHPSASDVYVARDTRASGPVLQHAVVCGLLACGWSVIDVGVLPSPALARVASVAGGVGIMISASHNPCTDNGIKCFDTRGAKVDDAFERGVIQHMGPVGWGPRSTVGCFAVSDAGPDQYVQDLLSHVPWRDGRPLRVVLDMAHGAAVRTMPVLLERLGVDATYLGHTPDGYNINQGCGALCVDSLRANVLSEGADLGCALDGDADRMVLVDPLGRTISGDGILYLLQQKAKLEGQPCVGVVGTDMSNAGLEAALQAQGIPLWRSAVGDRAVWQQLQARHCWLGGEPSGHVMDLRHSQTGDPAVALMQVLDLLRTAPERTVADWLSPIAWVPQWHATVPWSRGHTVWDGLDEAHTRAVRETQSEVEAAGGRVLIRVSGTEPVLRLMVECRHRELAVRALDRLKNVCEAA